MKRFLVIFSYLICATLLAVSSGCATDGTLFANYDVASARSVSIEFLNSGSAERGDVARFESEDAQFSPLIESLAVLKPKKLDSGRSYAPLMSASHIISVTGEKTILILYYDQIARIISAQKKTEKNGGTTISYSYFEPTEELESLIADCAAYAMAEDELVNAVDASGLVLRASITAGEINAEGEELDFSYLIPPPSVTNDEPIYRILLPSQSSLASEGRAIVIASFGLSRSAGDSIDIEKIDVTADFIRVYISLESASDTEVASHYPVAAALVDVNSLSEDKSVMFITTKRQLLSAHRFTDPVPAELR